MSEQFDPYYTWLGIPPEEQPPDYYRLLGIRRFENNAEVIANVLGQRLAHLRSLQSGERAAAAQQVLDELAKAGECLACAEKKGAYDRELRQKDAPKLGRAQSQPRVAKPTAPTRPSSLVQVSVTQSVARPAAMDAVWAGKSAPAVSWQAMALLGAGGVAIFCAGVVALVAILYGAGLFSSPPAKSPQVAQMPPDVPLKAPEPPKEPGPEIRPSGPSTEPPAEVKKPVEEGPTLPVAPVVPAEPVDKPPPADTPSETTSDTPGDIPNDVPKPPVPSPATPVEPAPVVKSPDEPPEPPPTLKGSRLPAPEAAVRDKQIARIRATYNKQDFVKGLPQQKAALAATLLKDSADETEPALLYACLFEVRRLKLEAGDFDGAFSVADAMILKFEVDPWQERVATLKLASKRADSPPAKKALAVTACHITDGAYTTGQFELAAESAALATANAERWGDLDVKKEARDWKRSTDAATRQLVAHTAALKKLEALPDDSEANEVCGKFLCLMMRDWKEGLPYWAKAKDAALWEIAVQDAAAPAAAAEQIALADRWWQAAEPLPTGREKDSLKLRAREWYQRGLPAASGLRRAELAQRIKEMTELVAKIEEATVIRERGVEVFPDPRTLSSFRSQLGQEIHFDVVGEIRGSVWGTDIYTADSSLSSVAVHAGVLKVGEKGIVKVTILPGQEAYTGSERNGVTTSSYGSYSVSYQVEAGPKFGFRRPASDLKKRKPGR